MAPRPVRGRGIAIAVATFGRHAAVSRRLAIAGAVPVVAANTLGIIWILIAIGRPSPFSGGFGLAGFWLGIAMWLADAWFGLVAMRIGALPRWVALGLVAGSLLAILGIDRIGLTSSANPTIFGPVSLIGLALNGFAWLALGIEVLVNEWRGSGGVPPGHLAT